MHVNTTVLLIRSPCALIGIATVSWLRSIHAGFRVSVEVVLKFIAKKHLLICTAKPHDSKLRENLAIPV